MNKGSVICPASEEKINESITRIIALFTIIVVLTAVFFNTLILLIALAFDFYLRTFANAKYSPLKYLAKRFLNYLGMPEKMMDAAPKKFAAGMGLFFTVAIAGMLCLHYDNSAYTLTAVLLICAGLESFKGFCFGSIIYTYLLLPFISKEHSDQSTISINL